MRMQSLSEDIPILKFEDDNDDVSYVTVRMSNMSNKSTSTNMNVNTKTVEKFIMRYNEKFDEDDENLRGGDGEAAKALLQLLANMPSSRLFKKAVSMMTIDLNMSIKESTELCGAAAKLNLEYKHSTLMNVKIPSIASSAVTSLIHPMSVGSSLFNPTSVQSTNMNKYEKTVEAFIEKYSEKSDEDRDCAKALLQLYAENPFSRVLKKTFNMMTKELNMTFDQSKELAEATEFVLGYKHSIPMSVDTSLLATSDETSLLATSVETSSDMLSTYTS